MYSMTYAEFTAYYSGAVEADFEEWRRVRYISATIMNMAGKSVKRNIRPEQLFKLPDETDAHLTDMEKIVREAREKGLMKPKKKRKG